MHDVDLLALTINTKNKNNVNKHYKRGKGFNFEHILINIYTFSSSNVTLHVVEKRMSVKNKENEESWNAYNKMVDVIVTVV